MTQTNQGETRTITLGGRELEVKRLKDTQLLLMTHEAKVVARPGVEPDRVLEASSRLVDMLESAIIKPEDRGYFIDLMVRGEVEMSDLMQVLTVFSDKAEDSKPVVRRGRPRKTAV